MISYTKFLTLPTGRSKNLDDREGAHRRDSELGGYDFVREYETDDYAERRGLEDVLYNHYPGAQKANGGLNKIRAISPTNKRADEYRQAARSYLDRRGGS